MVMMGLQYLKLYACLYRQAIGYDGWLQLHCR